MRAGEKEIIEKACRCLVLWNEEEDYSVYSSVRTSLSLKSTLSPRRDYEDITTPPVHMHGNMLLRVRNCINTIRGSIRLKPLSPLLLLVFIIFRPFLLLGTTIDTNTFTGRLCLFLLHRIICRYHPPEFHQSVFACCKDYI